MLIELRKVDKIYRSGTVSFQALKGVDLSVEEGEMIAICGRSGAGKSTLLHIIGCIDAFDGGSYCLDGNDVGKLRDGQYVPEDRFFLQGSIECNLCKLDFGEYILLFDFPRHFREVF